MKYYDDTALPRDDNHGAVIGGIDSSDPNKVLPLEIDPLTGRALVQALLGANSGVEVGDVGVISLPTDTYSAVAVDANSTGDTSIVTASVGQNLRLHYLCLSANGANSADVTVSVKIGSSVLYKVSLKPGAIWARNISAGRRYLSGSAGDDLLVTLSADQTVHTSAEYEII